MPILTSEERIGTTLAGKYRLDRILGKGGFGVVYAGVHELTGREIATKILKHELGEQEQFVKRFLQEARAAAGLNHPNVVDVLDLGQEPDGTVFIVLELLSGQDLSSILEERAPLSVDEAMSYLLPVMSALAKAHERGIVHRDLKPDNIFLNVNSKGEMIPKLLDFGIAKMSEGGSGVTSTGMIVGTPHYMSPEQVRGSKGIGAAADVWSMGVVLWQCFSGTVPFDSDSPTGVLGAILTTRAASVATVAPNLPPHVIAAIDGALRYEVEHRIPNMGVLVAALRGDGAAIPKAAHSIRTDTGPMQAPRQTPATVNMAMTPVPGGLTPLPGMTPPPMHTPSMHTPTGERVAPPRSNNAMVLGGVAAAVLVLVGLGVLGAVALWPSDEPEETAEVAPTAEPAAPEPTAPPPAVAQLEPATVEPATVEPAEPAAVEPATVEPAAPEAPSAPIADARPRRRPVVAPPRALAPPPVIHRPVVRTPPRVGTQGAPILR